ncbi:hypothetical protein MCOR25_004587 [Pyricularia grisea]|uniref:MARVEL domain-containing protein n=1 Tax=Pyricularia grisea TaxID=148305 RepID=A0A6P8BC82_PYRGI|nr:uncharacterized protein PgNI_03906 [Pyricularia grisea]KAI6368629.1 hypothetical protein MCOR25_004587 [Pyricularia grisea]TLD13297.1 hypothetical protein PgNI_03906 [Pyricularia grisea]
MAFGDERKRPAALNLTPARSGSTDSTSTSSSLKNPRTPRFAEATSIHSPIEDKSRKPFDDERSFQAQSQPGDIGFGYINESSSNRESVTMPMTPRSPLKSAMRVPGTPARKFDNPLSPTFREEQVLEKREASTDIEQAKDLKVKTRVRMAKFALRGVNFSCSLIILAMISTTFTIFNATKSLPSRDGKPAWSTTTEIWPQIVILTMASISLLICVCIFLAYCRGGHARAEKVGVYYTLFAVGWFIFSMVMWAIAAGIFQHKRNSSGNQDMWGWSCVQNHRADLFDEKVDYALLCRLQNWTMVCIIIEIVVEVIAITLYSIVFYRYYSKRKLHKSMDLRDKARSDLYLAQLRSQSAPNTPGFGPKSPAFSQYAMSPRFPPQAYGSLGDIQETSPFTPGGRPAPIAEPQSSFAASNSPTQPFKLQAPPLKAPSATPRSQQNGFESPSTASNNNFTFTPSASASAAPTADSDEPRYDAVPIPGAYSDQAVKSPPPTRTAFQ